MPLARQMSGQYLSEAEYLEGEKLAAERHEYVDGQTYLMAGASKRHNRIARNFINRMEDAANRKGCEVFFSDVKVRVAKYKTYYYPDVVVSCSADDEADEDLKHGTQIDLLIDRSDKSISICEMKYCNGEYEISNNTELAKRLPEDFNYAGVISFAGANIFITFP